MSQSDLLEAAEAALTDDERAPWRGFIDDLQDPSLDHAAVRSRFFLWAGPLAARLGLNHPGRLWPALERAHRPKKRKVEVEIQPLATLAGSLPYPLGMRLSALLRADRRRREGEAEAQLPFELCAVMGVVVRLAALVAIRSYVDAGGKNADLNHLVVDRLRAPTDGGWLEVARRLIKELDGPEAAPLVRVVGAALKSKPKLSAEVRALAKGATSTAQALDGLVKFRNDLVHGEPQREADLARAMAMLEVTVRGFAELARYRLEVRHGGRTWSLNGTVPRPIEGGEELPEDEPCLCHADDAHPPLALSPLLRFRASEDAGDLDVDFDELFFLNAGTLERLSYIGYRAAGQIDGKTLGSYEAFKDFIAKIPTPPIPQDPRIDFSGLAAFHSRLFVGRGTVLKELADLVATPPTPYLVLKALAGMGKSAIFGVLLQAVLNRRSPPERRTACVADALLREGDRWVFHFCMPTDGRNSPTVALRSLIAQICDHLDIDRGPWLSHDVDKLKDEQLPGLLLKASEDLSEGQRLVIVVDALDEGIGAEQESVPSCIPTGDYPGVVFLLSYRVDEAGENSRVAQQLRNLPADRVTVLEHADPLAGLTRGDVDVFLDKVAALGAGVAVADAAREATWAASTQDSKANTPGADPFYLRFVAEGAQAGSIRLDRAETVPSSLDDAFEEQWMGLPADRDFLCHRVLLTLGIMREYGDDELFAALFNRERPTDDRLTPDDVAAVRVRAGKLLVYDGDRYGLFHDRFRRFLVGEQKDPIAEALGMA